MSVLILGATSRIAQQLAHRYAEAGSAVFVAARDLDEAERIAADVRIRCESLAVAGAFDALAVESHPDFVAQVEAEVGPIDVAIVAFGEMGDQQGSEEDFLAAKRVIDVNYTGAASICEAVAAKMVARGAGAIVGITSVAGDRGRQSNYFYGSAKGAFTLYLQGLRNRLYKRGVHVLTVKLGFVDTRMTYGMSTAIPVASPEAVSRALFKAEQRREDVLYYPRFWKGIMHIIRHTPEAVFKRLSL